MVVPNATFPYLSAYVRVTNGYFEFLHVFSNYFYLSPNFLIFFNVYLFLRQRERDRARRGEGPEREGDTESKAGSRLRAVSTEPHVGLELTNCEIVT